MLISALNLCAQSDLEIWKKNFGGKSGDWIDISGKSGIDAFIVKYDLSGNVGVWKPQAEKVVINISHLPDGIYFLNIATESGKIVKKIIKN